MTKIAASKMRVLVVLLSVAALLVFTITAINARAEGVSYGDTSVTIDAFDSENYVDIAGSFGGGEGMEVLSDFRPNGQGSGSTLMLTFPQNVGTNNVNGIQKTFSPAINLLDDSNGLNPQKLALSFWLYLSDVSWLDGTDMIRLDLGKFDVDRPEMAYDTDTMAQFHLTSAHGLVAGWNHIVCRLRFSGVSSSNIDTMRFLIIGTLGSAPFKLGLYRMEAVEAEGGGLSQDSYAGNASFIVAETQKEAVDFEVTGLKDTYEVGEELGPIAAVPVYSDGTKGEKVALDASAVSGFDTAVAGVNKKMTVAYSGMNKEFTYSVLQSVYPVSAEVVGGYKVEYVVDEALDLSGMKLHITYSNGSDAEIDVTEDMVDHFSTVKAGTFRMRVYYDSADNSKFVEIPYEVVEEAEASVTSVAIVGEYKTKYSFGESLDLSGMKLEVAMDDGTKMSIDVIPTMVSGYEASTTGEQTLTVTYEGKTATFTVTVAEAGGCGGSLSGAAFIFGAVAVAVAAVFIEKKRVNN